MKLDIRAAGLFLFLFILSEGPNLGHLPDESGFGCNVGLICRRPWPEWRGCRGGGLPRRRARKIPDRCRRAPGKAVLVNPVLQVELTTEMSIL